MIGMTTQGYSLTKLKGVASVNDPELDGSADSYADTVNDTGKLFVHYFARNCDAFTALTGGACTTITEDMVPPAPEDVSSTDLPGLFALGVRAYIRPGTERGPDSTQQLRPRLLTFTQP